jgi:hypothetical protein
MTGKIKILANWCYYREDVTRHLLMLNDHIEWVFLFRYNKVESDASFGLNIIHWNNYSSPYELLEAIKPDKVLFHDIESFHQVALNIAAKNRNIPTIVLEHGMRSDLEIEIAFGKYRDKEELTVIPESNVPAQNNTFSFFIRALQLKNLFALPRLLHFVYNRKKYGLTIGLYRSHCNIRKANIYINFTLHNASYIIKRDGIPEDKIINIGNPSFDDSFNYLNSQLAIKDKDYFLLVDAPYCEQEYYKLSREEKIRFYEKLNSFCLEKKKRLVIKLHPLSYNSDYLPTHENMVYYRETNIAKLIAGAEGCFMINFSTLSPLIMIYSPVAYFNTKVSLFDVELTRMGLLKEHDFYAFVNKDIMFTTVNEGSRNFLINKYLYKTDGKATERLQQILLG